MPAQPQPLPPPPPPPQGSRKRPRAPPPKTVQLLGAGSFPATLLSLAGQNMRVVLSKPNDGETCPLTLSPIAEDTLEFLPDECFCPVLPDSKRLTLPCGHAFGALNIIYHFARQNMLCPCCRAGFKSRISIDSIPCHVRTEMVKHVNTEHIHDIEEQTAADADTARELMDLAGDGGIVFINFDYIYVSVYYHSERSPIPCLGMQFRLETDSDDPIIDERGNVQYGDPNAVLTFHMPLGDRQQLAMHAREFMPDRISLVVHTRTVNGSPIELARTEPFETGPREGTGPLVVPAAESHFEYFQIINPYTHRFIQWRIPCRTFVRLMLPRPIIIEVD